jgi:predicted GNAT family acetyltransferase
MEIKHLEKGGRGGFIVRGEGGNRIAEMTYTTVGETGFIIDHTEVDDAFRGQNIGESLLEAAVKHARSKGLKIYATCPFALAKLKETPEYADVLGG